MGDIGQVSEFINEFARWLLVERGFSKHTVRNYCADVELLFEVAGNDLSKIDETKIELFVNFMAKHGAKQSSIARRLSSIRTFYRFLKLKGFIDSMPILHFRKPRVKRKLPNYLSEEEMAKAFESVKDPPEKAILEVLYSTGIRVSELCALNIDDVDLAGGRIRVIGKGGKERIVFLTEEAMKSLREYLLFRLEKISRMKQVNEDTRRALFITSRGRISDMTVRRILKRIFSRSGIKKRVYPHLIRHTIATHLLEEGMNLKGVQTLLGHKNIQTTEVYTHVSLRHLLEMYRRAHPRGSDKIDNSSGDKKGQPDSNGS
ncbi:MAG: site-specific tyrosine recombinase/integron integrase [Thermosulfidibacteraceae bacterium]|jgi:integrase/recombinase XerC